MRKSTKHREVELGRRRETEGTFKVGVDHNSMPIEYICTCHDTYHSVWGSTDSTSWEKSVTVFVCPQRLSESKIKD